jgi:hypothetical protein
MARIFEDSFAGTLDTLLRSHTPDTGVSWDAPAGWPTNDSHKLDANATDAGAYCWVGTEGGSVSHVDPATGLVTVRFKYNRLTTSTVRPPQILIRASTAAQNGYVVGLNIGSSRFELVRYDAGTPTAVLKTWTGVTLATPSVTEFYVTVQDVGGNPVIAVFYGDGTQIGTSYTDTSASKIVQAAGQEFGIWNTGSHNVTSTTGTHLAWYAIDDSSAGAAPPTLTSIAPDEGTEDGGTAVTLTGTDFVSGATVTIGGAACTSVTFVNATSITAVTPAGTVGARDVVITNPDAQSDTLVGGFTYLSDDPVVTISQPDRASITASAGTPVAVVWTATDLTDGDITAAAEVYSGNVADGTAGYLGAGPPPFVIDTAEMSAGARVITVLSTDSDSNQAQATFTLTIGITGNTALEAFLKARARAAELGGY